MSNKLVQEIKGNDCVGDSVSKHNYNIVSLDTEICNLSSTFFNIRNNYLSVFSHLCSNIDSFNEFADVFYDSSDLAEAATATEFLSAQWEKNEITITYPINILNEGLYSQSKIVINDQTSNDLLSEYGLVLLDRTYSPTLLKTGTTANVVFLMYNNTGTTTQTEDSSFFNGTANDPYIIDYNTDGTFVVPKGVSKVSFVAVGGGGAGGRIIAGGGGGGGGVAYYNDLNVTAGNFFNITIGRGQNLNTLSKGQPTTVNGNGLSLIAYGGENGQFNTSKRIGQSLLGGAGGTAQGGTSNYTGGNGGNGESSDGTPATAGSNGVVIPGLGNFIFSGGGGGGKYILPAQNNGGTGGGGRGGGGANAGGENGALNTGGGGGGAGNGNGGQGGNGKVLVIIKEPSDIFQSKRYYRITQRKNDLYISSIKIAKFIVSPENIWTFLNVVQ